MFFKTSNFSIGENVVLSCWSVSTASEKSCSLVGDDGDASPDLAEIPTRNFLKIFYYWYKYESMNRIEQNSTIGNKITGQFPETPWGCHLSVYSILISVSNMKHLLFDGEGHKEHVKMNEF